MYLHNGKMAKLSVFVDFLTNKGFEQKYKTSLQNETLRRITKKGRRREVFCKNGVLKNSQENTFVEVSFLIKRQVLGLKLYLKRYSNTGVFL